MTNSKKYQEWYEFENCVLVKSTEKAGLFSIPAEDGNFRREWIPWSWVDENSVDKEGERGSLIISERSAIEKGLI